MGDRDPAMAPTAETADSAETGLLAGVDEAGLGPILGPLVVAGVAMSGPRGSDPWDLLSTHVSREKHRKGRIRVADSKKVKQGKYGMLRLEQTVLAFWAARHGAIPETVGDLLDACGVDTRALGRCPWYGDLATPLPLHCHRGETELGAHMLAKAMADVGIELLELAVRPVDVEEFNASIRQTNNKSDTHFHAYAEVISRLLAAVPGEAHLVADRCGGRMHYAGALRRELPGWRIRTGRETQDLSSYELAKEDNRVRVTFTARGEDRAFPTALASCAAKYVRELLMTRINAWFAERVPELEPTAGYYVDGNRFLVDVGEVVEAPDFPVERLVRCR